MLSKSLIRNAHIKRFKREFKTMKGAVLEQINFAPYRIAIENGS